MRVRKLRLAMGIAVAGSLVVALYAAGSIGQGQKRGLRSFIEQNAIEVIEEGRQTFRFDTFGDEAFWGDALKLQQAILGASRGGVGPGLSP